ncbi:hypothetical protein KQR56_09765 [Bacillus velezensis]|nr:hypothetical protein [Bacillus velezensis]
MSQGDLADCLETHQTAVSQFELNKRNLPEILWLSFLKSLRYLWIIL